MYYKNLHLMTKCFVAGSVVVNVEGVEECAEDAEVILKQNSSEIARIKTDIFGDFKIDRLDQDSGQYELEVHSVSSGSVSVEFDLGDESLYLGTMTLPVGV